MFYGKQHNARKLRGRE